MTARHIEARRRRAAVRHQKAAKLTLEGECACGVTFIVKGPDTQRAHLHAVFLSGTTKHRTQCEMVHIIVTEAKAQRDTP